MKLRLRSFESQQTLKIDVPNSCTLTHLKQIIAQSLPNSPSPDSIRVSLNRKDDLRSDGVDSLRSLGIAAGDLIYFSLDQPPAPTPNSPNTLPLVTASSTQNPLPEARNPDFAGESSVRVSETVEEMDVEDEEVVQDEEVKEVVDRYFSVPGFLRKVFMTELGVDDAGKDHKLIIIAVHAVMLESGFVGFDKNTNSVVSGFQFGKEWPSPLFRLSLFYTLKESPNNGSVMLKFLSLGKFINVYGTLGNGSGKKGTYHVQLNEGQLVPFLNVVWANCGLMESISEEKGGLLGTSPQKEVFKFWRSVKDNLALPLLIDICEEFGLELPPCFMRLPTDLKLKILESLKGVDIAKASCVCSELRYLGLSEDLWKMKFEKELTGWKKSVQESWKKEFGRCWGFRSTRQVIRIGRRARASSNLPASFWVRPRRERYPNPFMVSRVPRIIEDDHEVPRIFSPPRELGARGVRFV